MNNIDIIEIMNLIPHRYPLLLIDKIIDYVEGEWIIAVKNVSVNEPQFIGHFPNNPVMPGVLIIEAMAQASAILAAKSNNISEDNNVYFMSIENTKFRKIVVPGDSLIIYSKVIKSRGPVWKFESRAEVDKIIVAESEFTAMFKGKEKNE